MNKMDNQKIVEQQYATSGNLESRISLHEKYSTNKFGWFNWLFSNYDIKPGDRILELGCGNGKLWAEHYDDLPENINLVLSDISENMVDAAKQLVGDKSNITYMVIDVQDIPYPGNSFDIVIANMMLYHVPDLEKGLSEIKRVLNSDGKFYCATFGENGIAGFVKDALHMPRVKRSKFTLQNGADCLKTQFGQIKKKLQENSLAVTDTNDLIAYIRTLPWAEELQAISGSDMFAVLEAYKQNGVIMIPKEYGTFIASNKTL